MTREKNKSKIHGTNQPDDVSLTNCLRLLLLGVLLLFLCFLFSFPFCRNTLCLTTTFYSVATKTVFAYSIRIIFLFSFLSLSLLLLKFYVQNFTEPNKLRPTSCGSRKLLFGSPRDLLTVSRANSARLGGDAGIELSSERAIEARRRERESDRDGERGLWESACSRQREKDERNKKIITKRTNLAWRGAVKKYGGIFDLISQTSWMI